MCLVLCGAWRERKDSLSSLCYEARSTRHAAEQHEFSERLDDPVQPEMVFVESFFDFRDFGNLGVCEFSLEGLELAIGLLEQKTDVCPVLGIHPHHLGENEIFGGWAVKPEVFERIVDVSHVSEPIRRENDLIVRKQVRHGDGLSQVAG